MKKYFKLLFNYHKNNLILYISLVFIISIRYYFKIPSPIGFVLKPLHIRYWSEGLTTAFIQLIKGNFYRAYTIINIKGFKPFDIYYCDNYFFSYFFRAYNF